jgi:hypothetical protein
MIYSMNLATSAAASSSPAWWITISIAGIAAIASISAAIISATSARNTKRAELRSQRASELEARISEEKSKTYRPIIEMFGKVFSKDPNNSRESASKFDSAIAAEFATWVTIYGSDGAIVAYHNFMQAAFTDAPLPISARLYAEFIIAARRDIGYPETGITAAHLLGIRITDLYSDDDYRMGMTLPFSKLCEISGWNPPWNTPSTRVGTADPTTPPTSS